MQYYFFFTLFLMFVFLGTQIIMAILVSWLLCFVFTVTDVFPPEPDKYGFYARTDARQGILAAAPWFKIPYPCKCFYFSKLQKDKLFVLLSKKELTICKMKDKQQLK